MNDIDSQAEQAEDIEKTVSSSEKKVVLDYDECDHEFEFETELSVIEKSPTLKLPSSVNNSDSDATSSCSSSNHEFPYLDLLIMKQPDEYEKSVSSITFEYSNREEQNEKEDINHDVETNMNDQEKHDNNRTSPGKIYGEDSFKDKEELHESKTSAFLRKTMEKMTIRSSTADDINYDHLKGLISSNQWKEASKILKRMKKQKKEIILDFEFKCSQACTSSHGLLHYACRCDNIPYSIIKQILKICPDDVYEMDCSNRNALHVAVEYCLSIEIIALLLKKNPRAAQQACSIGNTPMHWAMLTYKNKQNLSQEENDCTTSIYSPFINYFLKLFKMLAHVAPNTIKAKNCVGDTPFEIVLHDRDDYTNTILDILWKADTSGTRKSPMKQYGCLQVERIKDASGSVMFSYKRVVTPNPYCA